MWGHTPSPSPNLSPRLYDGVPLGYVACMSYYVYILASRYRGTLYVGVTNDIARRCYEHKMGLADGFTKKYAIKQLVYIELHDAIETAITREKLIKRWRRSMKFETIEAANPDWKDLYETLNQ